MFRRRVTVLLVVLVVVGGLTLVTAQESKKADSKERSPEDQKRIHELVDLLASGNAWPRKVQDKDGCEFLVFPKDFDWKGYRQTKEAALKLLKVGTEAIPELVAHAEDERFCCVVMGDVVAECWSVADMCSKIIRSQVEVYDYCRDETRLDCGGPTWPPRNNTGKSRSLAEWWRENQGITLLAMQTRNAEDALKSVKEHRLPRGLTKDERLAFEERRTRNLKSLKTLLVKLRKATKPEPSRFFYHFEGNENPNGGEVRIQLGK